MPWREVTRMSLREEFVQLALQAGVNRREAAPALRDRAEDRLQVADALRAGGRERSRRSLEAARAVLHAPRLKSNRR